MKRLGETAGAMMALALTGMVIALMTINVLLGCETWDETLWTPSNSCLTPTMIWENINGL